MIQEIETKQGFKIIKMDAQLVDYFIDLICDYCGTPLTGDSYYISVLNQIFCEECYNRWISDATYYKADAPIEEKNHRRMKQILKLAEEDINGNTNNKVCIY